MNTSEQINFRSEYQLWKVCAKPSEKRTNLEYVCFKDGNAYASNAHVLARVDLIVLANLPLEQLNLLDGYCIHNKAYKLLLKRDSVSVEKEGDSVIIKSAIGRNELSMRLCKIEEVNAPNFEAVMREEGESVRIGKIGLNRSFLGDLTSALGISDIRLDFFSESKKILVRPISETRTGIKGIIMPIAMTGSLDFEQEDQKEE